MRTAEGQAKAGVEAAAGLLDAQASVVVGTAEEQGGLAFAAGEDGDADAALAQVAEHTGGEIDAAAQEHAGYGRRTGLRPDARFRAGHRPIF